MNAAMELGGTKTVVAIGEKDGTVSEEYRYATTAPEETLAVAAEWFAERGTPHAIGIAAFGPVRIQPEAPDYGHILDTPKPDWSGYSILADFRKKFPDASLHLDTDVNAACLAEAKIGAAKGLSDVAYITIGTGIGAGVLSDGRLVHGNLHPEFGHLKTPRAPGDNFLGVCPFHGDCLEGMASGPAIEKRWGKPGHELPADHAAWDTEAWYLAHGILSLLAIVSPSRVVIGGGVSQIDGLHEKTENLLNELAAGYFPALRGKPYVVPPAMEQMAGIIGALLLTR